MCPMTHPTSGPVIEKGIEEQDEDSFDQHVERHGHRMAEPQGIAERHARRAAEEDVGGRDPGQVLDQAGRQQCAQAQKGQIEQRQDYPRQENVPFRAVQGPRPTVITCHGLHSCE